MELERSHKTGLLVSSMRELISSNVQHVGRITYIEVA
jgi:hypothetical protein